MGKSAFIVVLACAILVIPATVWDIQGAQAQAGEGWTMAGGNPQQNGASAYNTTDVGNGTQWIFRTGDHAELKGQYVTMIGLYVGPDGTIYSQKWDRQGSGSNDGFAAINPDGTMKWFSQATAGNFFAGEYLSIGQDGTIYCLVYSDGKPSTFRTTGGDPSVAGYRIAALDSSDGSVKWEYVSPNGDIGLETYPVASPNGQIVFFEPGSVGYGITALNSNGSLAWRLPIYLWKPQIAIDPNSTIYALTLYGTFCSIDQEGTERLNVSIAIDQNMRPQSIELDGNGNIYIVASSISDGLKVRILKYSSSGSLMWSYGITDCMVHNLPVIDKNGTIYMAFYNMTRMSNEENSGYIGTSQGILSLDRDGNLRWTIKHESGQMALSNDGVLYVASANSLFALGFNGTIIWEIGGPSGHATINSQGNNVAIGPGGTLYFLGQLSMSNGLSYQGYIMSVKGIPSPDNPNSAQNLLLPIILVAVVSIVLALLYVGTRRKRRKGR